MRLGWLGLQESTSHQEPDNLGAMYYNGEGVEKNIRRAYLWMSLAANQGDQSAMEWKLKAAGQLTHEEISRCEKNPKSKLNLSLTFKVSINFCASSLGKANAKATKSATVPGPLALIIASFISSVKNGFTSESFFT